MTARRPAFVVTCEHGGNRVPARYRALFGGHAALLDSHRAHDPGALGTARALSRALDAPLFSSTVSRLVIDLNRSIGHPRLFSAATRAAPRALRREIVERHYLGYRASVEAAIGDGARRAGRVVHVASHSFTPVLEGVARNADIGLLYDPSRAPERDLCLAWQAALGEIAPGLRVRRNYPYRGASDGFTTGLRRAFGPRVYAGIELEINQCHVEAGPARLARVRRAVIAALLRAL